MKHNDTLKLNQGRQSKLGRTTLLGLLICGLSITTLDTQATVCGALQFCEEQEGGDKKLCAYLRDDPSVEIIMQNTTKPRLEIFYGLEDRIVFQATEIGEIFDGQEVPRSSSQVASSDWNGDLSDDLFGDCAQTELRLEASDEIFKFLAIGLRPSVFPGFESFEIDISGYDWVSEEEDAKFYLEFSLKSSRGAKPELEPDGYTVSVGSFAVTFDDVATDFPARDPIDVKVEVIGSKVRLIFDRFLGTLGF